MKVGIYSHCTIDTIVYGDSIYEVPGGPACYCSLTARKQKFDVNLSTKYGADFPLTEFLLENNISLPNWFINFFFIFNKFMFWNTKFTLIFWNLIYKTNKCWKSP